MFTTRAANWSARTGCLAINGKEITTPNFIIATTRGAVPHLTPDHAPKAPVVGIFAEDLWDQNGLVTSCTDLSSMPLRAELVLGACRKPGSRKIANKPNSADHFSIDTVQGSKLASVDVMTQFMTAIQADVFIAPYDVPSQSNGGSVGKNRVHKMQQRSLNWLDRFWQRKPPHSLVAATIPSELYNAEYLEQINDKCDAYCFLDSNNVLPEQSGNLPKVGDPSKLRINDTISSSWTEVLNKIKLGTDLIYVQLHNYSDRGLALTLEWDGSTPEYIDLNADQYTLDTTELGKTGHSFAYIHHLLEAKEMTAQVLLQLYNYDVVERLFDNIRRSIDNDQFESEAAVFLNSYTQM